MDGQLVHFELPAEDAGRAKEFWKSLFGWKFREVERPGRVPHARGDRARRSDLPV